MKIFSHLMVLFIAILHIVFLILEMFLWDHPVGYKVFATTPEFAATSAVLAMNQGLYNGFLAAGLIIGLVKKDLAFKVFFLSCIIVAVTAKISILFVQGSPALLALIFVLLTEKCTKEKCPER